MNEVTDRPIKIKTADGWQDLVLQGPRGDSSDIAAETHAATSKSTPVDADEIPLVDSAASFILKKLTWDNLKATLKTYFDTFYGAGALDGWADDTGETWIYASGSAGGTATFTVSGDKTAKYTVGTRIKLTQTTVKYFVVIADPVFSSGNTTITISAGTDYTLANDAISANYHSYAANPQGYPGWFNYNFNVTGFSSFTSSFGVFSLTGRVCVIAMRYAGTSNSTSKNGTLPIPTNSADPAVFYSSQLMQDAGTPTTGRFLATTSTNIRFDKTTGGVGGWTASGSCVIQCTYTYQV